MIRIGCLCFFMLLAFQQSSSAALIYLKDGQVIKAKILQRGSYFIDVQEEGGKPNRYNNLLVDYVIEDDAEYQSLDINPRDFADISERKLRLIIRLLELTGVRRTVEKNLEDIVFKAPLTQQAELEEMFDAKSILRNLIPVYDEHLTEDEIAAYVDFYGSPEGRRFLEVSPTIMSESLKVMMEYFKDKVGP